MPDNYQDLWARYHREVLKLFPDSVPQKLEFHFESLRDWSVFHSLDEVRAWFSARRQNPGMEVEEIPLNQCQSWLIDPETGDISHASGEFFRVHGLRTLTGSREAPWGWDQPILTQVGFDGGVLGLLRQRHQGIPHYLVEAKAEPGNYGVLQLSPTLQATGSNLKQAHGGRKPLFSELFEDPTNHGGLILSDQWLSEDGGRLYLKRNRGMLVEISEDRLLEIPENFLWLSFYQIKQLLGENAWINPHIRGIIAPL